MQRFAELIKSQDIFGAPVLLNYRGKESFNTLVGGCCTIFVAVILASGFAFQLMQTFNHPKFVSSTPMDLFENGDWNGQVTIDTEKSNLAVLLYAKELTVLQPRQKDINTRV